MARERDPSWFIGARCTCVVCTRCYWDLRSIPCDAMTKQPIPGLLPERCIFNGPFKGYVQEA